MAEPDSRELSGARPTIGCPHCIDGLALVNWTLAQANPDHERYRAYSRGLECIGSKKACSLFRCRNCGEGWLLRQGADFMTRVESSEDMAIAMWANRPLVPTDAQLEMLAAIGASGGDGSGDWDEFRDVPCRCRLHTGEELDFCVVRFSDLPPSLGYCFGRIVMIDEVSEIFESDFALSWKVREAALKAPELRMMFAPTLVKNSVGQRFVLNGRVYFMDYMDTKGCDISLADSGHSPSLKLVDLDGHVYSYGVQSSPDDAPPRTDFTWVVTDTHPSFQ